MMSIVTMLEMFINILWALTPFSFLQAIISTPVFALVTTFGLPLVTCRNFGQLRDLLPTSLSNKAESSSKIDC